MLANPSLSVNAGAGLTGGGSVSLGGTTTVSLAPNASAAGSAVTAHPFTCSPFATLREGGRPSILPDQLTSDLF
jgi:hypothetical protein